MKRTIFDSLCEEEVSIDPFEHSVIRSALDPTLCRRLIASRPERSLFGKAAPGKKVYIKSDLSLSDHRIHPIWKETIDAHLDPISLSLWLKHFAPQIRERYRDLESHLGPIDKWKIGRRGLDSFEHCQALSDAIISWHLECPGGKGQERGPHVKLTRSLLLAELLLRLPEDDCGGGDFVLYDRAAGAKVLFGPEQQVLNRDRLRLAKTIPYSANTCFTFVNSPEAIHCMSERVDCPYPIFYMNVVIQLERPLFQLAELTAGKRASVSVRKVH